MIVKNGEIIAIGKVKHDDTLSGTGISDDKLGLSQKVRDAIGNKQNKLTPADNTIAISNDQIRVNTSGISAQQIHPSVFDPYASKEWVSQGFLPSTALDSYALSADVRNEFDASAAWINERFDNVPGAETYYGGNGIEVIGHQINLTADVVSHDELNQASAAAFNTASSWVTDQHYLKEADLNNYATKEYVREASAAAVSTTEDWVEGQGYLTSVSLEPYAKTTDVNAQFNATSAWANTTFQPIGDYVSAADLEEYKNQVEQDLENIRTSLDDKLDRSDFDTYSAKIADNLENIGASLDDKLNRSETTEWDITEYSAGSGIKIQDHKIEISADYVASEDLTKVLDNYYTKDQTSAATAISDEFTSTSAWANDTFQSKGEYVSASDFDSLANKVDDIVKDVTGLYNVELSSTDNSIGITATTAVDGTVKYDLTVDKVTLPDISGKNGISAYFDENESKYIVGLENYNDIGFAKYSTVPNTYTTSAVVTGYQEDLNVNPTKIALTDDQILLKNGFYHIDAQINFIIGTADNNYYDVMVKSIPNAASITQMIDASYGHTETVDLSFDIRITNDDTPIEISVENYKTNETFAVTNLNIHEIVSMPSQIDSGVNNYQAGNGIAITNDTIEARLGNGLAFNESNAIQIKLGKGLKCDESQGVQRVAVTIDNDVEDVVEDVNKLQVELDTKITDNFPPSMITLADLQVANGTQYAPGNGGMLIGYLFTCPITHNIYANNEKYQTKIGIYTKQWSGNNNKVILGIYEYNPDYNKNGQIGRTVALCDTGIIDLQQGYAEYEIKNLGNDTSHEMTPGKFYYATIYLSYLAGDTNGIMLFGAPGYNMQVNALKPGITITNIHKIRASLYDGLNGYSPDLNFDQMGFSWQYDSYPPQEGTTYTSQDIVEAHTAGRPYFAIRNIKKQEIKIMLNSYNKYKLQNDTSEEASRIIYNATYPTKLSGLEWNQYIGRIIINDFIEQLNEYDGTDFAQYMSILPYIEYGMFQSAIKIIRDINIEGFGELKSWLLKSLAEGEDRYE